MIIIIIYDNCKFEIDTKFFDNNTYFYNSIEFLDNNILNFIYLDKVSISDFKQYILYLTLDDFIITDGFLYLLDFDSGIKNIHNFPIKYFEIKLREDRIRNYFYKLELYKDQLYKLIKPNVNIELNKNILNDILNLFDNNAIIAGGSILTNIDKKSDIDIFFFGIEEHEANEYIKKIFDIKILEIDMKAYIKTQIRISKHAITFRFANLNIKNKQKMVIEDYLDLQIIFRLYKSKAEILYGFDLDCCGILYDGSNIYCTEKAEYSIKNKINHLDIHRFSPSYIYRLAKYKKRGYEIYLPNFNKKNIDKNAIIKHLNPKFDDEKILNLDLSETLGESINLFNLINVYYGDDKYNGECNYKFNINIMSNKKIIKNYIDDTKKQLNIILLDLYIIKFLITFFKSISLKYNDKKSISLKELLTPQIILYCSLLYDIYPDKIVSYISLDSDYTKDEKNKLLSRSGNIFIDNDENKYDNRYLNINLKNDILTIKNCNLYHIKQERYAEIFFNYANFIKIINIDNKYNKIIKNWYLNIKWIKQDPMKQLTGTFNPQTIEDIEEWYKIGGFYK